MIDNFDLLLPFLEFNSDDEFYFLQIIKRRKDNPGLSRDMKLIDNYFIYSKEYLVSHKDQIIEQCTVTNSRAYLRLNRRSARKVAFESLKIITEAVSNEQYKAAKGAYLSACGNINIERPKRWLVDIDVKDIILVEKVEDLIRTTRYVQEDPILVRVPTLQGYHIITAPFDHGYVIEEVGKLDIKKDNPTLLFKP